MEDTLDVLVGCSGLFHVRRGYETHAEQIAAALGERPGLRVRLVTGTAGPRSRRVWCLPRTGRIASVAGRVVPHRMGDYLIEQASFVPGMYRLARGADSVVLNDQGVALGLATLRRLFGGRFAILLVNGAPRRGPFPFADHVLQLTPEQVQIGLEAGESAERMSVAPSAVDVASLAPPSTAARVALRELLGVPTDRPLIVSVGALNLWHKRHDHLIREVAMLHELQPHLAIIGQPEGETGQVVELARVALGDRATVTSAPAEEIATWLHAADVFALASTTEGFSRAIAEACVAGLRCALHDQPVFRDTATESGVYVDMTQPGKLSAALAEMLATPDDDARRTERHHAAASRLGWAAAAPTYEAAVRAAVSSAGHRAPRRARAR